MMWQRIWWLPVWLQWLWCSALQIVSNNLRCHSRRIPTRNNITLLPYLSDQFTWSLPYTVLQQLYKGAIGHQESMEPERLGPLEAVGFKLNHIGNLGDYFFGRFGGHYIDVGASRKIADGQVKKLLLCPLLFIVHNSCKVAYICELRSRSSPIPYAIHLGRARFLRQLDSTRRCGDICHRLPHKHALIRLWALLALHRRRNGRVLGYQQWSRDSRSFQARQSERDVLRRRRSVSMPLLLTLRSIKYQG